MQKKPRNRLAAIARSSYRTAGNNALRAYDSYRPGEKKIIVDINNDFIVWTNLTFWP